MNIQNGATGFSVPVVTGIGIDGADHVSAVDSTELKQLLAYRGVVCLRFNEPLTKAAFEHAAELFGPIKDPVGLTRDGTTLQYSPKRQVIDAGYVTPEEELGSRTYGGLDDRRPGLFETFHCDDTYTEDPAWATILHARQLPPSGGGPTHFIDMRVAYELLDETVRQALEGLHVLYAYNNENAFPPRRAATGTADVLVEVTHPLVRTHHLAGTRALFIDLDRAKQVVDMPIAEGRKLLQQLQDFAEEQAPACQHDWQAHDVLVWDNATVQHKAQGNFKLGEPRRFWRHLIAGPPPA